MSHPVLERLRHPDPAERRAACREAPDDPSAVLLLEGLAEALGDADRSVMRAASDALVAAGRGQPETESLLRRALRGDSPRRRWGAAFTFARLAPPDPGLLPAVVEAMDAPDGDIRWAAARLLVDMGRLHPEILRVAVGLAREGETPALRRMALFCLRELAPDDPHAAAALLEASLDADPSLRRAAVTALAALLDPPPEVTARLRQALADARDPVVRRLAAVALGELAANNPGAVGEDALGDLRRTADSADDEDLRRVAGQALARAGGAGG